MNKEVIVVTGITFKRALTTSYEDYMTFQTMNVPILREIESERCDAFFKDAGSDAFAVQAHHAPIFQMNEQDEFGHIDRTYVVHSPEFEKYVRKPLSLSEESNRRIERTLTEKSNQLYECQREMGKARRATWWQRFMFMVTGNFDRITSEL